MSSQNPIKDLDQKQPVFEYLKKLVPSVFRDGILNFDLLKQHLNSNEKIIQNTRNFVEIDWTTEEEQKLEYLKNVKSKTLLPDVNQSLNFDQANNIIIEGDNLEVMKILEKSYFNQVDVIYIDPPYHFINYLYLGLGQMKNKYEIEKTLTIDTVILPKKLDPWYNLIHPRLKMAKNLLKEDGIIFISIDDNEQARLKLICDQIFNKNNFVATMIWRKKNTGAVGYGKVKIQIETEYVLCYAKNRDKLSINSKPIDASKYSYKDKYYKTRGGYKLLDLDRVCSASSFKYQSTLDYEIQAPDGTWFKNYRNLSKEKSYACTLGKGLFDFCNENGFIKFKKTSQGYWKVYRKYYQLVTIDHKNKKIIKRENGNFYNNIIDKEDITIDLGIKESIELFNYPFPFSKPTSLIKYLINIYCNKKGLVLDFFAGSGTTAQAVMELNQEDGGNRKYILVQLPERIENSPKFKTICDITRARIIRSIEKYQYNDLGFKYFKVGSTNLPIQQVFNKNDEEEIAKEPNYEVILYELMLKVGMRLDQKIENKSIDKHQFWIDEHKDYCFFLKPQNPDELFSIIQKIILSKKTDNSKIVVCINKNYFKTYQEKDDSIKKLKELKQIQLMVV